MPYVGAKIIFDAWDLNKYDYNSESHVLCRQVDGQFGYVSNGIYATTGSNFYTGNQTINGNVTINGDIIANEFLVTTSSVNHFTASTNFGLDDGDTHTFTGSVYITGSLNVIGGINGEINVTNGVVSSSTQIKNYGDFATTGSNLFRGDQTITGSLFVSGNVNVGNTLNFSTGSFINSQIQIEAFLTNYTLSEILDYSTGSMDDLEIGTYNISNGVPAPWTAFRLGETTLPITSIEVNDILAGVGILPSTIVSKGGSGFTDVVVVDLDLSGLTQILPSTGSIFSLLRPLVKPALTIETPNGTDILLNSQGLGDTITNTNIVPLVTAQNKLGLPTRRWKEIWVASGSIYMQDETLGIDLRMTARDGNFVVDGAAGLEVGEFTLNDNQIKIKDPNREIIIGQTLASGSVVFNRPIKVNASSGQPTFNVGRDGRIQIISPQIPAGDIGAFSIIGNSSGLYQPVTSDGSMVHITGNDGKLNRFNMDSFGTGSFNSMVFRTARGTAASPLQLKANDTILRLAGAGWKSDTGFGGPSAGFSAVSIDFVSLNDQTSTTAGTQHQFYNSPLNQNVRTLSATLDASGLFVSGTFTSSLSQGHIWVGGDNNRTKLFSTSSFATTGSNVFNGSQGISGSLYVNGSIYKNGNKQFNYGQWVSLYTQSGSANTAYAMKLETPTDGLSGMYVGNNGSGLPTRIYVENSGLYNIQFSAQLHTTANEACDFSIWFAMTGSNIANSNTDFSIEKINGGGFQVAALNFLTPISSGSYVELYWSKTTANGQLQAKGVQSTPTRPATPSAIVTLTQIA